MPHGKKYGGRTKGTPNKATAPVREAIADKDPIGKLFDLYEKAMADENYELAQRTLATVLPYGFPRLASQQIDLEAALSGGPLKVVFKPDPDE